MDNYNNTNNPFAAKTPKPLNSVAAIVITAIAAILSGFFPAGFGGAAFLCIASALLAYVLSVSFRLFYLIVAAAISLLVAFFAGVDPAYIILALSFIPIAVALTEAVKRKATLSTTVIIVTAALILVSAVALAIYYILHTETAAAEISAFAENMQTTMKEALSAFKYTVADGKTMSFSENDINTIINSMIMQSPSLIVLTYFFISYIICKIYRLIALICDNDCLFNGGKWYISAGLPASVLFTVCYFVSVFSSSVSVVYYSAMNLLYMLLPAMSIVGFRCMFGRNSNFRGGKISFAKILLIFMCLMSLYISPVMLFILASFFTVFENIKIWRLNKIMNNKNDKQQ